jgi:GntR family transcriptional regulator
MSPKGATNGATRSSAVDRSVGTPLYAQIRDALRQQIESHSLPPGAPLPTEEALQTSYGVSRSVVRQALGELGDLGLIHRQRGRGTVVAPHHEHHRRAEQAGGLSQQLAARGEELRTEILHLTPESAPEVAAEALQSADTWKLERIRSVNDEPLIFMRTWIPRDRFPTLNAEELDDGSLHDWMRAHGATPSGGPRQVQAVPADESVARHLDVHVGVPVLLLQGVTLDEQGRGLEWFTAWHRPGTVFDVDAQVGPRHNGRRSQPDLNRVRELVEELTALLDAHQAPNRT